MPEPKKPGDPRRHPQSMDPHGRPYAPSPGVYGAPTRPDVERQLADAGLSPRTSDHVEEAVDISRADLKLVLDYVRSRSGQYRSRLASVNEEAEALKTKLAEATQEVTTAATANIQQAGVDVSKQMQQDALAAAATLRRWWKIALVVGGFVVTAGASCGAAVFGYVSASRAAADQTKGVATEAAKKAVEEVAPPPPAPAPTVTERIYYYPERFAPGMTPAFDAGPGDR